MRLPLNARWLVVLSCALVANCGPVSPEANPEGDQGFGPLTASSDERIYADALASSWENWSWGGKTSFAVSSPTYEGKRSISFTCRSAWGALYLHRLSPRPTDGLKSLRFAARASRSGQQYSVAAVDAAGALLGPGQPLANFGGALSATSWTLYDIPLSALGAAPGAQTSGFSIQDATGKSQPALYVDDVRFVADATVSADAGAGGGTDAGSGGGAPDAGTGGGSPDAGSGGGAPDAGPPGGADAGSSPPTGWMYTSGNHLWVTGASGPWHGRGANLHDTRSCDACTWNSPNVTEVNRRVDQLVAWGATFIRLDLESYASSGGRVHWANVLQDPAYLQDVANIVAHIGTKPGVYVLLSLWVDPTFTVEGWPSAATGDVWEKLATTFVHSPHVLYGLVNEPKNNFDGAQDAQVWNAMNATAARIRAVETAFGAPHHVVVAQGTGGWARRLAYYVTHPLTAGGGQNFAYEVHVYDASSAFSQMFVQPAQTLPVIIGEFGPAGTMSEVDAQHLMDQADQLQIPWLAWTFHMRCAPNLLIDYSGGGCGVGMALSPTSFGTLVKNQLASPF